MFVNIILNFVLQYLLTSLNVIMLFYLSLRNLRIVEQSTYRKGLHHPVPKN